jgi:hypothetical protein
MKPRLASGRADLMGHGVPWSVPINTILYPPALYAGAQVYGTDGNLWWSDGVAWRKAVDEAQAAEIADDVLANVFRTQLGDLQLIVDADATEVEGAVYNTINDALEFASLRAGTYRADWADTTAVRVNIHLAAGFVWREQVRNFGVDLSRVTITAEDLTVSCEGAFLTKAGGGNNTFHPAVAVFGGAGPNMSGFVLVYDGVVPPQDPERVALFGAYTPQTQGARIISGGVFTFDYRDREYDLTPITPRAGGFRGFHTNVENGSGLFRGIACYFDQAINRGLTIFGGSANLFGCDFSGAGIRSIEGAGGTVQINTIFEGPDAIVAGLYGNNYRRNGLAGADTTNDLWVSNGGTILNRSALTLGGLRQSPNVWTANGVIFDVRDVSPLVVAGLIQPQSYTVGTLPAAGANTGRMVYVTNGAVGAPILAFSDGTNWLRSDTRAAVSAT